MNRVHKPPFPDQIIEERVSAAIAAGASVPRWGWKTPGPYNGATGAERVAGWQKLQIAFRQGWMSRPTSCSICGGHGTLHCHTEIYFRPILSKPICQSCHFRLHRRFRSPDAWRDFLVVSAPTDAWAVSISSAELTLAEALWLASRANPLDASQLETFGR